MSKAERDLTSPEYWDRQWEGARGRKALGAKGIDRTLARILAMAGEEPRDILELGCAPGEILERMHRLAPQHRYHGLDYSPEGVAATRERLLRAGIEATIHEADLRTFDRPAAFDLVASFGLIEHFEDPAPVAAAHARLCRPGGLVAVTVPNYAAPMARWFLERMDPEAMRTHVLATMDLGVLRHLFEGAGLAEVVVRGLGGPKLRTRTGDRRLPRKVLRHLARIFNAVARALPARWTWHSTFLAAGVRPAGMARALRSSFP